MTSNGMGGREHRLARKLARLAHRRQRGRCFWCGASMNLKPATINPNDDPRGMTADHIVPRSKGGRTSVYNIVAACYGCNNGRGDENGDVDLAPVEPSSSPFAVLRQLFETRS